MSNFGTEQEEFWAGEFGDEYSVRNASPDVIESNIALFSKILGLCPNAGSLIEFGANTGLNLRAIRELRPNFVLDAVEINDSAAQQLREWGGVRNIHRDSILNFQPNEMMDVSLIKGVLIHINPEHLSQVYDKIVQSSKRYVVVVEYYNPTPVEVAYRGHSQKLFKRDFAREILDSYPELKVVEYGFVWHRDPRRPQDDVTWFVLEKC